MAVGITHAIRVIENVGEIVVDCAGLFKGGFGSVGKAIEVMSDVRVLVENAKGALPELQDVDQAEAAQLAAAAYVQVKRIVAAVVAA